MLETREIEVFLAVASELHFGRAAERLHLSTSRVSQTIRALERRLGGPLFERTSRTVRLTPLGEQLLASLKPIYERLDQVVREVQQATRRPATLTVGFSASLPSDIEPALTEAFEADRDGNHVVAVPVNPMDIFLWDERADVGLDAIVGWLPPGVGSRPTAAMTAGPVIRQSPPALLMSAEHPLAGRTSVDIEELAGLDVLYAYGLERLAVPWVPETSPGGQPIKRVRREVRYLEGVMSAILDTELVHLTILNPDLLLRLRGLVLMPVTGWRPFGCHVMWSTSRETPVVRKFARLAERVGSSAGWV